MDPDTAMSQESVEFVRRLYKCWAGAELDRMPEILHPEIVWTATEKRSGLTTEIHFAGVFRFADDGRIRSIHEYARPAEALQAVGVSE